jgi:hypothetical protein
MARGVHPRVPRGFTQNFSETVLKPVDGRITVPTGDGAEAFADVEDIAAVAVATLASPDATPAPSTHRPAPTRSR